MLTNKVMVVDTNHYGHDKRVVFDTPSAIARSTEGWRWTKPISFVFSFATSYVWHAPVYLLMHPHNIFGGKYFHNLFRSVD